MKVTLAVLTGALMAAAAPLSAQSPSPSPVPGGGRFIIDSHQHYQNVPDYFERLARTYRARNAMACVLTPVKWFDAVRKGAAAYSDVVIPYVQIDVDDPHAV